MSGFVSAVAKGCVSVIGGWQSRIVTTVEQKCEEIAASSTSSISTFGLAAVSFDRSDDRERGISGLGRLIAANPALPEAHAMLSALLAENGDPQGAITEMRIASELSPRRVEYRLSLGRLIRESGQPLEAVKELRKIVSPRRRHATVHLELSLALADLGRNAEARDELQELLNIAPAFKYMDAVQNLIERLDRADQQPPRS